jgi:hypothetical protein
MRVRICPENGAKIEIIESKIGNGYITQVEDRSSFPEGLMYIALLTQQEFSVNDGVIEIPEGATIEIHYQYNSLCTVEVHRNKSKPMIHITGDNHLNSGKPLFHHVDGEGYLAATRVPNPLEPVAAIWCFDPTNQA